MNKSNQLTFEQKHALKSFEDWINCADPQKTFVLSGFAGSGKTYLSIRLLEIADDMGFCWTVVAPTHKAVGVLRNELESFQLRPTWFPSTIHRLLRLKLRRKGDLEICEKTDKTLNSLEQLGLVLIDEASMIDSSLLSIVLECAQKHKTRLVFVGDPAQLPPVGESISPVFTMKNSKRLELKEVVRHQGPVLRLSNLVREGKLPCEIPPCMPSIKTNKGLVGFLDEKNWLNQAKIYIKNAAHENKPEEARIICFKNRTIEKLVPHVRRAVHGEMADQLPVLPGEVLLTRNAVMSPAAIGVDESDGEDPDVLIGANRELIVQDVEPEVCDLSLFDQTGGTIGDFPLIKTLKVIIKSGEQEFLLRLLPPLESEQRKILDITLSKIKSTAKDSKSKDRGAIWRSFFLVRDSFANLGPASVLTVHRSQGSTFKNVFVASDVYSPNDLILRRQLFYVAVSRAKKSVWLVGNNRDDSHILLWKNKFEIKN